MNHPFYQTTRPTRQQGHAALLHNGDPFAPLRVWILAMESAYRPEHAEKVIEVARNELELLLKQRATINKKVKQVKRTVEGLTVLFGPGSANTAFACGDGPRQAAIDVTCKTLAAIEGEEFSETLDQLSGELTLYEEEDSAQDRFPRNNTSKPKLERACRIALLESEEAVTAAEIYDRIIRRGSYQLDRCKHPLAHVISALDELGHRGEVLSVTKGDCRHWLWNMEKGGYEGRFGSRAVETTTGGCLKIGSLWNGSVFEDHVSREGSSMAPSRSADIA